MILDLFPLKTGIWSLGMDAVFDQGLYEELLQLNACMQTGDQIWERKDHNIFDGHSPRCQTLQAAVLSKVQELLGPNGRVAHVQGREVVRASGVEIMPHNDEDECDVQAVYFPLGPELDDDLSLMPQVNQFAPNGFAICNPAWRSSGFAGLLMPWESPSKFWIKPHRGLLIAFDARAIHFQKPYFGGQPFMNILFNIKLERIHV